MTERPLFTVAIPAFNRARLLPQLLDSALRQEFADWDCVIVEDGSPERQLIRQTAQRYIRDYPGRFTYHENDRNLGYDGNFRRLVELSRGRYVFIMGNDDLIAPGAFHAVARAHAMEPEMGLLLRTYAMFRGTPDNLQQVSRYYPSPRVFAPGVDAIVACYRRLSDMSGLVLHRDDAYVAASERWDGHCFYQHWLALNLLRHRPAVFLPEILAYFRRDGVPDFGNATAERGKFTPGSYSDATQVQMVRSQLEIARATAPEYYPAIERDYANYVFPTLAHLQQHRGPAFEQRVSELAGLGLHRYAAFHVWVWAVRLFGARRLDSLFRGLRQAIGHTPNLTRAAR